MKRRLWYESFTEKYIEGLPVGNGRLAAMMLGRPELLRIALNHEWMWRGENRFREFPDMSAHLPEVREALLAGENSGEPRAFDSDAFLTRMRMKHGQ